MARLTVGSEACMGVIFSEDEGVLLIDHKGRILDEIANCFNFINSQDGYG